MKNLTQPTGKYLLEQSLESIHQESKNWLSEIEFWKIELIFFQKLLDQNASHFTTLEDKQKIDQFQNFIIYYTGELLDKTRKGIRKHEKSLVVQVASNGNRLDDDSYRKRHSELSEKMEGLKTQIKIQKKALFQFIEQVM